MDFTMKCVQCGHNGLRGTTTTHEVHIGDAVVQGTVPAEACPKCKEVYVSGDALERLELQVAEQVARSGVVSGATFRFMRKALGLQAKEMLEVIGTPPETVSRWETGARDVDRFAWITLATMVIDKAEERAPSTRDVVRATLTPSTLPRTAKVA
jgi:YgiT-type zinc finger domain-containing protein